MYGIYWVNAPQEYDYSYVRDTGHSVTTRQVWRLVVVTDVPRFGDYQIPLQFRVVLRNQRKRR